jgi:membrane associated rhomboid family serine protease
MDKKLSEIFYQLRFPVLLIVILWLTEFYETFSGHDLYRWGIYPREWDSLIGVITAPLIHSDFEHLISNTVPLFTLTSVMIFFYRKVALPSYIVIQIFTGLAVWIFARPSYHIGASGVVYGLVSFVFWSGVFRRNIKSIVLALIIVVMYSGYFYGILPNKEGVSWESHLFGGIVGIFAAFLFKNVQEEDEKKVVYSWELEEEEGRDFLPRDIFEKTKEQRRIEAEIRRRQELWGDDWTSDTTF